MIRYRRQMLGFVGLLSPIVWIIALAGAAPPGKKDASLLPLARPASSAPFPLASIDKANKRIRIEITPTAIHLNGLAAFQRVAVTATLPDGSRHDVTTEAILRVSTPRIVAVTGKPPALTARADGDAVLVASWRGQTAQTTITVSKTGAPFNPSFVGDVVPTLARLGCSQGACHGAQQGKGGFRLSLRGYAPEMDWGTITRQFGGRRITREAPEKSLLLRKPLGEVPHRGGTVLSRNSPEHRLLLTWLRKGAGGPTGKEPGLARLEVFPASRQMKPGARQRLLVRAVYSDGREEDVTGRCLFSTNDAAVATVDGEGVVTQRRPGETAVLVSYRDGLAAVRFTAPFPQKVRLEAFRDRANFIDDRVNAKLRALNLEPSLLCTDQEFLRRAYLDTIGTLPTAEEARAFLDDTDPKKRDRLVDALLQRPEWGLVWSLKFGDLLVLRREYMGRKNTALLQHWLTEQFNANKPWDKIVTELLTANGDPYENPAAFFFVSRTPQKEGERYWIRKTENTAEMAAQLFLGARIGCAKCHNHPTEKVTQDDYYRFVALWQQVTGKGKREGEIAERVEATGNGDVRHPRTGEIVRPQPLNRTPLVFAKDEDRRVQTVRWMIRQPEFVRNVVNRVWARCFGQGIIEPVDDIRSTNPAKNEGLMQALCGDFVSSGYDMKRLMGLILKSRTYQRSSRPTPGNRVDTRYFSHYYPKRLGAEELVDAMAQVTGVPDKYQGHPLGARAIELADAEIPSITLDLFGRPPRVMPSDSERTCNPAVTQALALLNGEALQQKLRSGDGNLPRLLKSGQPDATLVETLYLSALSRRPTKGETQKALAYLKSVPSRDEGFQDLFWALLNTKEFLFTY